MFLTALSIVAGFALVAAQRCAATAHDPPNDADDPDMVVPLSSGPQSPPKRSKRRADKKAPSLEGLIGSRLLPGLGAVMVLLGAGYLLDYAIERSWITPGLRALCGLLVSLGIAGAAQLPRVARLGVWSDLTAALGFGGAYFSLWYAGEAGAGLLGPGTAIVAGHLLGLLAIGCGVLRDRPLLTSAALVGAFLAPLFLGHEAASFLGYFSHALVVAGAALAASLFRDQTGPRTVAFIGVVSLAGVWLTERGFSTYTAELAVVSWILLAFGVAGAILPALLRGRTTSEDQITLTAGTLAVITGLSFAHADTLLGAELLGISALFGGLALFVPALRREEFTSLRTHLVVACVVFASAAPAAFFGFGSALGALWCLEAAALLAFSSRGQEQGPSLLERTVALIMIVAGSLALVHDASTAVRSFGEDVDGPVFGIPRLLAWTMAALGAAAASETLWRRLRRRESFDSIVALGFTLFLCTLGAGLFAEQLLSAQGLPLALNTLGLALSGSFALLGVTLRAAAIGRQGLTKAGPWLYLPLALSTLFSLFIIAFANTAEGRLILIPILTAVVVAVTGFVVAGLGGRSSSNLALLAPIGFTMLAGQVIGWDLGLDEHLPFAGSIWWAAGFLVAAELHRRQPRATQSLVLGAMALGGIIFHAITLFDARGDASLFFAPRFLGQLIWTASLTFGAIRMGGENRKGTQDLVALLSQIAFGVIVWWEVQGWSLVPQPVFPGLGVVSTSVADGLLSAFWAVHAAVLIALGFRFNGRAWRLAGLGLFLATTIKVLGFDLAHTDTLTRVVAAMAVGCAMLGAGLIYARRESASAAEALPSASETGRPA